MMQFLFVKIPHLLYEPIAVAALLGLAAASVAYWKKHDRFYWCIAIFIIGVFSWRLSLNSLMISTRYASILLYPAVIFTAWLCFYARDIIERKTANICHRNTSSFFLKNIPDIVLILLITGFTAASIIKTLRYNPYAGYSITLGKTLAKDISGKDFIVYTDNEMERIAYYAGIDINNIQAIGKSTNLSTPDFIKEKLQQTKNFLHPVYFIFKRRSSDPEPDAKYLALTENTGTWECLYRGYMSRRKDKEIVLYRFTPAHPNIEEWISDLPGMPDGNMMKNGDFETVLAGKPLEDLLNRYKTLGASSYADPGRLFPVSWYFDIGKWNCNDLPDMRLSNQKALTGLYSLSMISTSFRFATSIFSSAIPRQEKDCLYNFFVRNEGTEKIDLRINVYSSSEKKDPPVLEYQYIFTLDSGKIFRIHDIIKSKEMRSDAGTFYFCISIGKGQVTLDQFSLVTVEQSKK